MKQLYLTITGLVITFFFLVLGACASTDNSANTEIKTEKAQTLQDRYQAVSALVAMGNMQKAQEDLVALAEKDPNNADAQFALAMVQSLAGGQKAQLEGIHRVLKLDPDHSGALSALGELQLQDKKYTDAEKSFDRSLKREPENFVAILGKANVMSRTDRLDQARDWLDRAIKLSPNYAFAWSDRALVNASLENYSASESDMNKAIELEPDYVWHYLDRGRIHARAGKPDAAISDFSRVLSTNPELFLARAYRAQMERQKDNWDAVRTDLLTVLEKRPDYYPAFESLALSYWKSKEWASAAQWFEKIYNPRNKNTGSLLLAALAWYQKGDKKELNAFINRARPLISAESLDIQVLRYLEDPAQEGPVVNAVSAEKNAGLRIRASLAVAVPLLKLGRKQTGVLFLQNVIDSVPTSTAEGQIATWMINEYTH